MLEFLSETEKLKERLARERGIGPKELERLVREKQEDYAGLLSEAAAVFVIAVENGLTIDTSPPLPVFTRLADLGAPMRANVRAMIERIYALKTFEKNGRTGCVTNIILRDDSGTARLVLWDKEAEKVEQGGLERGDEIEVLNATVKNGLEGPEIHLGAAGSIKRVMAGKPTYSKISALKEGKEQDVIGRILEVGKRREFERNGKKSSVAWCIIGDETGTVRLILWEPYSALVERIKINDVVKIESGIVRKGFGEELELHVGGSSRLLLNPKNLDESRELGIVRLPLKKASELAEGEEAEVRVVLSKILSASDSRTTQDISRFVEALFNDDTGEIKACFKGKNVLGLLGLKTLADDISTSTVLKLKEAQLVGKEYFLIGRLAGGVFNVERVVGQSAGA